MDELTPDELRRIQRTLRGRFRIRSRSNILDVGFGVALKGSLFRPDRGLCVTFLVQHKKDPRKTADLIPQVVEVRVKRGRRFARLCFPSDVVKVGPIVAVGSPLAYRRKIMTTGVIAAWKTSSNSKLSWGLITAGHGFPRLQRLSQLKRTVTVRTQQGPFVGSLIAKSNRASEVDAAIVLVEKEHLIANRLLRPSPSARSIVPRPVSQLAADQYKSGYTLRADGKRPFRVHAYFPSLRIPSLGAMDAVVSVFSQPAGTFAKGTSGSSWLINNQAACLQIAARTPDFRQGFGQSLATVAEWAAKELETCQQMPACSFRIVATF